MSASLPTQTEGRRLAVRAEFGQLVAQRGHTGGPLHAEYGVPGVGGFAC